MTFRVSISGAFSTGKTTVLDAATKRLREAGRRVGVIGETARTVLAAGYPLDRDATIEGYLFYVCRQLESEYAARDAKLLLSDRSLMDFLAYVLVNDDPKVGREFVDLLATVVRHETLFFDMYCYLPVEFPPAPDGEREVDPVYQESVSVRLRSLMDEYGVRVVELRGSIDQRVAALLDIVSAS